MLRIACAVLVVGCRFSSSVSDDDDDGPPPCVEINHDEDLDEVDDACDSCPGIADPTFADDDKDGVGDACDPKLGRIDRQVEFISFVDSGTARWAATPGWTWDKGMDLVRFRDPAGTDFHVIADSDPMIAAPFEVSARVVIEQLPGPTKAQIGVMANVKGAERDGLTCAVLRMSNNTQSLIYDPTSSPKTAPLPPMYAGAEYRLALSYDPATGLATCTVNGGATVDLTISAIPTRNPLGFEAVGIVARVEYAVVYTHD